MPDSEQISPQVSKPCCCWPKRLWKTTWVSVFLSVILFRYIASITKEKTFSTAMINADTQLVFLDEWSPDHLQSDTAKLLLISAVKYEKARMFRNNSAFYITTNNVPNLGEDEDANVKRLLQIFETQSMPNTDSKIEPWYRQNSMYCLGGKRNHKASCSCRRRRTKMSMVQRCK